MEGYEIHMGTAVRRDSGKPAFEVVSRNGLACAVPDGAASHDGEGLASRRNELIAAGILKMFVYETVSARRAGTD